MAVKTLTAESEDDLTLITFRVEEDEEGLPMAVFDRLAPEEGELLSQLLYPSYQFVSELYGDALRIKDGGTRGSSYSDGSLKAIFGQEKLTIESLSDGEPSEQKVRLEMTLAAARYVLLRWKVACMKSEALRRRAERER